MIGNEIDKEDPHWQNFLLHLQINDYFFAPTVSNDMAAHLHDLIVDHHKTFKELYMWLNNPKNALYYGTLSWMDEQVI